MRDIRLEQEFPETALIVDLAGVGPTEWALWDEPLRSEYRSAWSVAMLISTWIDESYQGSYE